MRTANRTAESFGRFGTGLDNACLDGDDAVRELVVVSDFQRSNWATADFGALPQGTRIRLESVAPASTPPNLGILRAGRISHDEHGNQFEVEVGNFSPAPQNVQVEVEMDDSTFRLEGICPAGARVSLSHPLSGDAGWHAGSVRRLGPVDALDTDDSRAFVVDIRRPPRYGLITRQTPRQRPSSSYFLERALAPTVAGVEAVTDRKARSTVVRIDSQQLDLDKLSSIDLFILDHPGKLSRDALKLIGNLVRRGKSMLYVASESVDASNLAVLAEAASSEWQLAVKFAPLPAGATRATLALADVRRRERPFSVFGDELPLLLSPIKFVAGVSTQAAPEGLADTVLASYSDRSACLAVGAWGAGQFAVWNVDLSASNLATSPVFVPLVQELATRILTPTPMASEATSGEAMTAYLPPEAGVAEGLQITGPADSRTVGTLIDEGASILWRLDRDAQPGVYQVRRGDETVFAAAVATAAEESDLRSLGAEVFEQRLAGGRDLRFRSLSADNQHRDDRWTWLLVACVCCMVSEVSVLALFRS